MRDKQLRRVTEVLDALVVAQQSKLARELEVLDRLRQTQLGIANEEQAAFDVVQSFNAGDPLTQAHRQAHLEKLRSMQTALQPDLARAALRREKAKDELKLRMRQQMAVNLQIKARQPKAADEEDTCLTSNWLSSTQRR